MKKDVVESLAKLHGKRGSNGVTSPKFGSKILDDESKEILEQFDLEYKAMKESVLSGGAKSPD